jgi:hypothetical protein
VVEFHDNRWEPKLASQRFRPVFSGFDDIAEKIKDLRRGGCQHQDKRAVATSLLTDPNDFSGTQKLVIRF